MIRSTTDFLKFICCILIFLHHYYLGNPLVVSFGTIACTIFFFFSAYGIAKSLKNNKYDFITFCKKRLIKIYVPLVLVNITAIFISYYIFRQSIFTFPIFHVSCQKITFIESSFNVLILYILGIKKLDSVTWFLDVLFISYLLIWFIMKIKTIHLQNILLIGLSFLWLTIWRLLNLPIWYIIDSVGIIIGLLYVINEKYANEWLDKKSNALLLVSSMWIFSIFILAEYYLTGYLQTRYIVISQFIYSSIILLPVIIVSRKCNLRKSKYLTFLGVLSYFVYLIHVKVSCIMYQEFQSRSFILTLLVVLLVSIIIFYVTNAINKLLSL